MFNEASKSLTPEGVVQAGALGNFIAEQHFGVSPNGGVVLHGQATRAVETANIIAEILGLSIEESRYLGGPEGRAVLDSWMFEGLSPIFNSYVLDRSARTLYRFPQEDPTQDY